MLKSTLSAHVAADRVCKGVHQHNELESLTYHLSTITQTFKVLRVYSPHQRRQVGKGIGLSSPKLQSWPAIMEQTREILSLPHTCAQPPYTHMLNSYGISGYPIPGMNLGVVIVKKVRFDRFSTFDIALHPQNSSKIQGFVGPTYTTYALHTLCHCRRCTPGSR